MFYRRKLIFAVLEAFGGHLEKIRLQKLLFLLCKNQTDPVYEFVPYRYGCFSYSAKADLNTMTSRGLLVETNSSYSKAGKEKYLDTLHQNDRMLVNQLFTRFKDMSSNALMKYTYVKHPYYAIKSIRAEELLKEDDWKKVKEAVPSSDIIALYTIGYEGISLEAYLNKLVKHDIRVLVDVRNNPVSQKFGFSKSLLQRYCADLQIEYRHLPELGIQSEDRRELHTQKDYDDLFAAYRSGTLTRTREAQNRLLDLLRDKHRIALTCFEADICRCHRKSLAEAIGSLPGFDYSIQHI